MNITIPYKKTFLYLSLGTLWSISMLLNGYQLFTGDGSGLQSFTFFINALLAVSYLKRHFWQLNNHYIALQNDMIVENKWFPHKENQILWTDIQSVEETTAAIKIQTKNAGVTKLYKSYLQPDDLQEVLKILKEKTSV